MAINNGVNYAKWSGSPFQAIDAGVQAGISRIMYDSYTLAGDLSANDTILMGGPLPRGAILSNARIKCPAMGGSCALSFGFQASTENPVGDVGVGGTILQAADTTAFFNALVVTSATNTAAKGATVGAGGAGDFYRKQIAGPGCQPVVTCSVASSGATGNKIEVEIEYIMEN